MASSAGTAIKAESSGHLKVKGIKHANQAVHTWTIPNFPDKLRKAKGSNEDGAILSISDPFDFPIWTCCGGGERVEQFQVKIGWKFKCNQMWIYDHVAFIITCLTLEADVTVRLKLQLQMTGSEHFMLLANNFTYSKPDRLSRVFGLYENELINHASRYGGKDFNLTFVTELELEFESNNGATAVATPLENFLWKDRESTGDVTMICGDQQVPAHRGVLASRSSVFAAMFHHKDTLESQTRMINIKDVNPECFHEFINFIYLNNFSCTDISAEILEALLVAADKYLVSSLKTRCEYMLKKMVNFTNVGCLAALANMYNAPFLRKFIVQYVTANYSKLVNDSDGQWRLLPEDIINEAKP